MSSSAPAVAQNLPYWLRSTGVSGVYTGPLASGVPHGVGSFSGDDERVYAGSWKHGSRWGGGIMWDSNTKEIVRDSNGGELCGQWWDDHLINTDQCAILSWLPIPSPFLPQVKIARVPPDSAALHLAFAAAPRTDGVPGVWCPVCHALPKSGDVWFGSRAERDAPPAQISEGEPNIAADAGAAVGAGAAQPEQHDPATAAPAAISTPPLPPPQLPLRANPWSSPMQLSSSASSASSSCTSDHPVAAAIPPALSDGLACLAAGDYLAAFEFFSARVAADSEPLNDASYLLALAAHGVSEPAHEQLMHLEQRSGGQHPGPNACFAVASYALARLHHAAWTEVTASDPDEQLLARAEHKARVVCWSEAALARCKDVLPADWCQQLNDWLSQAQKPEPAAVVPLSESAKLKLEWEAARKRGDKSSALDKLFELTGLASVKRHMLEMMQQAAIKRQQGVDVAKQRNNAIFSGNPGVGKTTVARLYADLMIEVGALPAKAKFVETTGAQLAQKGAAGLEKMLAEVPTNGLVLFVDEPYQLAQLLNLLLTEMENAIGRLIVVFAGYAKDIEQVMSFNVGLPSRFPHKLVFDDYSDDELLEIAVGEMSARSKAAAQPFVVEGGANGLYMRVAIRRLGRGRDRIGFGNARAVQTMLDSVFRRQNTRLSRSLSHLPNRFEITREDLIGVRPTRELLTDAPAWKSLQSMIGLRSVKAEIERIAAQLEQNYDRELKGAKPLDVSLNRVFLGNPGTGKTTVAKLYGALLKQLGVLSKGDLVSRATSDFIGAALGQSESQTKAILSASEGCVLMIDEAYGLNPASGASSSVADPYRTAAVDTLVEGVQNVPGEDRCVLMLGYREPMERFFNGPQVNPGLKRRFGWTQAITFDDFSKDELNRIFVGELKRHDLRAKPEVSLCVSARLEQLKRQPNFGNAGAVKELIGAAILARTSRIEKLNPADRAKAEEDGSLLLEDVQAGLPVRRSIDDIFKSIVGCDSVKAQLRDLESTIRFAQQQGSADAFAAVPRNFVFLGPPGVGKTSVARLMGELFLSFGLISSAEVLERSASDLSTQFAGSAGPSTMKVLRESLGKVLLIDEAHMLSQKRNSSGFGGQSLDELVKALTSAEFYNKLIVILAGYDTDMRDLLSCNAGLASRFPTQLAFEPFTVEQCWSLIHRQFTAKRFKLAEGAESDLTPLLSQLIACRDWGNGRDCGDLVTKTIQKRSAAGDALVDRSQTHVRVESALLRSVMEAMLTEKRANEAVAAAAAATRSLSPASAPVLTASASPPAESRASMQSATIAAATAVTAQAAAITPPDAAVQLNSLTATEEAALPDGRDAGVSDEVWRQLQADIVSQEKREAAFAAMPAELEAAALAAEFEAEAASALHIKLAVEVDGPKRALLRKKEEEQRRRLAAEQAEQERLAAELSLAESEREREVAAQSKLRTMGVCLAGFHWIKQAGGYRCLGGTHFVTDAELQ